MAAPVFPLGTYTIDKADYSAGVARTSGDYCLVRKRYGNNQAIYNYAAFPGMSLADFQAICSAPDSATTWMPYPYSAYDWQLLVTPLAQPLAPSTAAGGASVTGGGSMDVTPVVTAIGQSNTTLAAMLSGQSAGGPRATETTLAKVAASLAGSLAVKSDGTPWPVSLAPGQQVGITNTVPVTGAFWQTVQPVTGPATNAELRSAPLPVTVGNWPATYATTAGQNDALTQLTALNAKLGGALTVTFPATQQVGGTVGITGTVAVSVAGGATAALQGTANTALAAIQNNGATAAKQDTGNTSLASIDAKLTGPVPVALASGAATTAGQFTGNTSLNSIDGKLTGVATAAAQATLASKQDAANTALTAIQASTAAAPTATQQTAANATLAAIQTNTTGGATAARQDIGNATLSAIQANTALGATAAGQTTLATKQDTANGYLQTLVTTGIATTAGPATAFSLVTLQGSNATLVRGGATWMLGGSVANTATAYRYLFLYNLATVPTGGTLPTTAAAGLVRTIAVPPNYTLSLNLPAGRYTAFPLGLVIAAAAGSTLSTVTSAAAGLTAGVGLTAGDLVINLDYAN